MKKLALIFMLFMFQSSFAFAEDEDPNQDPVTEEEEGNGTHDSDYSGTLYCYLNPTAVGCPDYALTLSPATLAVCQGLTSLEFWMCAMINQDISGNGCTTGSTAIAFCQDGSVSCSRRRQGACSSHGGVDSWIEPQ